MLRSLNPCELAIDLLCRGLRIGSSCNLESDARPYRRTRAGLGSGLELVISGRLKDVWLNAPTLENFALMSPYLLEKPAKSYVIVDDRNGQNYSVRLPPAPHWYGHQTSSGKLMADVGVLQGTYLAIYLGDTCGFWRMSPRVNCHFCTTGLPAKQSSYWPCAEHRSESRHSPDRHCLPCTQDFLILSLSGRSCSSPSRSQTLFQSPPEAS